MSNNFPGPLRECDQDVERAAAERYRIVTFLSSRSAANRLNGPKESTSLDSELRRSFIRVVRPLMSRYVASGDP